VILFSVLRDVLGPRIVPSLPRFLPARFRSRLRAAPRATRQGLPRHLRAGRGAGRHRWCGRPLVVETGSVSQPRRLAGDGQSTRLFDAYVNHHGGRCLTVDIDPAAVALVRELCSARTKAVKGDSVRFSRPAVQGPRSSAHRPAVSGLPGPRPRPTHIRAPFHHMKELTAVWRSVGPGTVIAVDDNRNCPTATASARPCTWRSSSTILGDCAVSNTGYQMRVGALARGGDWPGCSWWGVLVSC